MIIRRAEPHDADAIYAIERATFPDDAWSRGVLDAELTSPYGLYLVAVDGEQVVGYGGAQLLPGATQGDIQTLAVAESHRGLGVGAALLDDLLHTTETAGATHMMLEVRADNPVARSLYELRGFAVIATRPGYYQPANVDALIMRRGPHDA